MATFRAGGREFTLAPSTIEQAEEIITLIIDMASKPPIADGDVAGIFERSTVRRAQMIAVIAIAMRASEPEMSKDWLRKNVLFSELEQLYQAVLDASGIPLRQPEESPAGETKGP